MFTYLVLGVASGPAIVMSFSLLDILEEYRLLRSEWIMLKVIDLIGPEVSR